MSVFLAQYWIECNKKYGDYILNSVNKKEKRNYFYIHGKLPGLNEYTYACRSSWQKGAKMKADIEKQISIAVGIAKNQKQLFPVKDPVYVDFVWFEDTRKRDVDNIISAKKYILDVLQKSGILPNDNRNWVINVRDTVVDDIENKVLVQIFPVPKEQLEMINKRKKEIDKEKRRTKSQNLKVKTKVPKNKVKKAKKWA